MSERARSFETVAAEYERHRPDYPVEALRWAADRLRLASGARVLDVGAGTGKLTRGLVALGFEVVAVEPGGPMLDELRKAVPQAEALEGPAEAIPLPDASVSGAFAAQAFHWFDREQAVPELHRVIAPFAGSAAGKAGDAQRKTPGRLRRPGGGGLALVWNWWDERDPLQRELGELIGYAGHEPYVQEELPGAPWFSEVGRTIVESEQESSPDALTGFLSTASNFLTAEPAEREASLRAVHELASRYGERFALPRLTYVFAFERLS